MLSWFEELRRELASTEIPVTVEQADELIGHFDNQKRGTIDACNKTITEGEELQHYLYALVERWVAVTHKLRV